MHTSHRTHTTNKMRKYFMCVCICVCVCVNIYVYIYTYIYTYTYIYIHIYIYINICIYTYIYIYIYTYMFTCICRLHRRPFCVFSFCMFTLKSLHADACAQTHSCTALWHAHSRNGIFVHMSLFVCAQTYPQEEVLVKLDDGLQATRSLSKAF